MRSGWPMFGEDIRTSEIVCTSKSSQDHTSHVSSRYALPASSFPCSQPLGRLHPGGVLLDSWQVTWQRCAVVQPGQVEPILKLALSDGHTRSFRGVLEPHLAGLSHAAAAATAGGARRCRTLGNEAATTSVECACVSCKVFGEVPARCYRHTSWPNTGMGCRLHQRVS